LEQRFEVLTEESKFVTKQKGDLKMAREGGLTPDELSSLRRLLERENVRPSEREHVRPSVSSLPGLTEHELQNLARQAENTAATAAAAAKAAASRPNTAPGVFEAGKLWEFLSMPGRSIEFYERALQLDPNFHEATARLAICLIKTGRLKEGLRVASDLARQDPEFRFKTINGTLNVTSMTVLGDALRVNNEIDDAIRAYEQALQLEPEDLHSVARLAELHLIQGQVDRAAALEPRVDTTFNSELKATLRLVGNDRAVLPAVTGLRLNAAISNAVV
jgi:tetratricopeptide (TPR) repeat protein